MHFKYHISVIPIIRIIILLAFLMIPVGCLNPIPDNMLSGMEGTISGTVRINCSGTPVPNMEVITTPQLSSGNARLNPPWTITDQHGSFVFSNLPFGYWNIGIDDPNFLPENVQDIALCNSNPYTFDVSLMPRSKTPETFQLDLLFVVDNSPGIAEMQQRFINGLPVFLDKLNKAFFDSFFVPDLYFPATLDLRLGVITADLGASSDTSKFCSASGGDLGKLRSQPIGEGCPTITEPWINYIHISDRKFSRSDTNIHNQEGKPFLQDQIFLQVAKAFSCIASIGDKGCVFSQPLAAIRQALDPTKNTNPGFLRENVPLAVIIFTDKDDCSVTNPDFFKSTDSRITKALGPLDPFRCSVAGVECDPGESLLQPGKKHHCKPWQESPFLENVSKYQEWLIGFRPKIVTSQHQYYNKIFTAVIAGPTSAPVHSCNVAQDESTLFEVSNNNQTLSLKSSCQSHNSYGALPAVRLKWLTDAMGPNGLFEDVCASGMDEIMKSIASALVNRLFTQACPII